jgi:hypothetical protein
MDENENTPIRKTELVEEVRSLTTDAAIALGPTLAVVANHYLNKPKAPPSPPQRPAKKD